MDKNVFKIYSDGGSRGNPGFSSCAFVVIKDGKVIFKNSQYLGIKTNNESEYYGVINALNWIKSNMNYFTNNFSINFFIDSELVFSQITGKYRIKSKKLFPLYNEVKSVIKNLKIPINFYLISREKNRIADYLVNKILDENSK